MRSLLDLVVVAEHLLGHALDEAAQAGDGDHPQHTAGPQRGQRVVQVDRQQLLADLGRQVGDDHVEAALTYRVEAVAEQRFAVVQAVQREVAPRVVDGDEVLVDQRGVAPRGQAREGQAVVAAGQVGLEGEVAAQVGDRVGVLGHGRGPWVAGQLP